MQQFQTDDQTLEDLDIFGSKNGGKNVFSYFDSAITLGGKSVLKEIFKNPLNDDIKIQERVLIIKHLVESKTELLVNKEAIDFIEFYLRQNDIPTIQSKLVSIGSSWIEYFAPSQNYYLKKRGVQEIIMLLICLEKLSLELNYRTPPELFNQLRQLVSEVIDKSGIRKITKKKPLLLGPFSLDQCDYAFRKSEFIKIRKIIDLLYTIDAMFAVAKATKEKGLTFPIISKSATPILKLKGVFHLFLRNPVKNDVFLGPHQNVMFITGANMAGKSTIIKSIAICIFLAQLGLPVPAEVMEMTLFNGLLTTINLSDNLEKGRSHFYNEVLRTKFVAEKLRNSSNYMIIFDELFRGTNVKDALESSLSVINSFSEISDSLFIISTHITEVAAILSDNKSISFCKFIADTKEGNYNFDYRLMKGVSDEHLGYLVLQKENVLQILEEKINSLKVAKFK